MVTTYTYANKSWLVVKEAHYTSALSAIHGTSLDIRLKVDHILVLLWKCNCHSNVMDKVDNWVKNLLALSHIATTQPHAAPSAFTHGLIHKWSYLATTVPDIAMLFQPLADVIRSKFIPCLTGRAPPNDIEHNLISLLPRLGGLGIPN